MKKIQEKLKCNKKEICFILPIIFLNVVFFFLIGERGYITMKDTSSYNSPNLLEGVMPIYPFLLNSCRVLFGGNYLNVVAAIQGLLAIFSVTVFLFYLKRKFELKYWEIYLLWLAVVLPFAVELPSYVLTHMIYTEGITYSLFYIFALFALETLLEKKWKWWLLCVFMAVFMGLIRPQLMLLLILADLLLFCQLFAERKRKVLYNMLLGITGSGIIIVAGVIGIFQIRTFYVNYIGARFEQKIEERSGEVDISENKEDSEEELFVESEYGYHADSFGQISSALICRTFYEAELEDAQYYKGDMKEIFLRIYEECDKREILFPYARPGLWMWEDLTQTDIYIVASDEISKFIDENNLTKDAGRKQGMITEIKLSLALTELRLHFGRFIYHCFRLMIPGFISCIFFNIEAVYLLCHMIVLFLYMSALLMSIYVLRCSKTSIASGKFMMSSIISCIVFVGVVNSIFFGMQRYFIYNMGVFYCAYYLVFRTIWIEKVLWRKKCVC